MSCAESPTQAVRAGALLQSSVARTAGYEMSTVLHVSSPSIVSFLAVALVVVVATALAYLALHYCLAKKGGVEWVEEQRSIRGIPSAVSMMALEDAYFTPDLVVPDGCQCVLFLLAQPLRGQPYDVLDSSGGIVLRVADPQPANPALRRVLLGPNNSQLAECVCHTPAWEGRRQEFQLLNSNQDCWAILTYEPRGEGGDDKCIIETRLSQTLYLVGSFRHGALNLLDSAGHLLASTTPSSPSFPVRGQMLRLRCEPLTDLGLAMCGLMCLQAATAG
eukprot:CAMPEP_0181461310 /NCGR_PEP_ID=MMETSP1110-20121109/33812_1 /TAXON_ID=174948 /ORGANISM="Symbiodinium sp., Strain CCMP421" /LENGTH=275 /DNA_ID=CAMNT_0023585931 /DNA_START=156 /DNA_END=983 /DNA_ORIENTATION=-